MKIETNNIYLGDSYQLIKEMEDNSVDLIYTDIPYAFTGNGINGGGGCFGTKKRNYHDEYSKVAEDTTKSGLAKRRSSSSSSLQEISYGIDYAILDEFVRVLKHIYIYGVVRNKYYRLWTTLSTKSIVSTTFLYGVRQTLFQQRMEHTYQI